MALADIKLRLWRALGEELAKELEAITRSQRTTHEAATHEEAKPENDKDTRALEQTYLARGLAIRVTELEAAIAMVGAFELRAFDDDQPIAITALVELDGEDGRRLSVLLAPAGGGLKLVSAGASVRVVTPEAPLGAALLGRRVGDEISIRGPAGERSMEIVSVA